MAFVAEGAISNRIMKLLLITSGYLVPYIWLMVQVMPWQVISQQKNHPFPIFFWKSVL